MLHGAAVAAGYRLDHRASVGSTNEDALALGRAGDPGRLWIVADRQTAGRGRIGRPWSSPTGNLHATLLLVDPCEPRRAPQLGFVAGVALARAVERVAGSRAGLAIKWPNDLLHDGAKLAGILVEGTAAAGGQATALGFGVNCASHPTGLPYRTTSLGAFAGPGGTRDALFEALSASVVEVLALWDGGENFAAIRRSWLAAALPEGSALAVTSPAGRRVGRFRTVDDDGRLILEMDSGCVTVEAGDVFLADQGMTAAS